MKWDSLEKECFDYLKSKLPEGYYAELRGGSNSTTSDIAIKKDSDVLFYVEVKDSPSQAGQFVILIKGDKFIFSHNNKCEIEPCLPIIDYLNENFDKFSDVEQSSIPIKISKDIQYDRLIYLYKNEKKVKYFITKIDNDFKLFKTEDLAKYFDVRCDLRRKRSGSQNIGNSLFKLTKETVNRYMEEHYPHTKAHYFYDGDSLKVCVPNIFHLGGTRIKTTYFSLYFSGLDNDIYTLKKLSDTNNPNVIFTLTHKHKEPKALLREINSYIMKVEQEINDKD